ncbi:MAG TPA: HEPN domain-containing protein [bacterium]|nr:HEPN domain-containing protein [bacterium]
METKELKGSWWLPGNPDRRFYGTLNFDNTSGCYLEIVGSLSTEDIVEIILGYSTSGDEVTLYNSIRTQSTWSFPGTSTEKYISNILFLGTHFKQKEDITFKEIRISCTLLGEWLQESGFIIKRDNQEKKIFIEYTSMEPHVFTFNDYSISFYQSPDIKYNIATKAPKITDKYFIKFIYSEEKSYNIILENINSMMNFLSLATREEISETSLEGITDTVSKVASGGIIYKPTIKIIYKSTRKTDMPEQINTNQMLFGYQEIKTNFTDIYSNWLHIIDKLTTLYSLYFGTSYNPRMYIENVFLNYVIALETYHRQVFKNEEISIDEHNVRIREIVTNTPHEYSSWLESKLQYSNEPTLRKRLQKLFQINNSILKYTTTTKNKFINNVVNTRNYLVHRDAYLEKKALRDGELIYLNSKLKSLVEMCLLRELGFNYNQIKSICDKPFVYMQLEI